MNGPKLAIQTRELTRNFGSRIAVNQVNLEIQQGEMFSLLGTNGAGKTTTIKMLCGLLKPSSGEATLNGFSIKQSPQKIKEFIGVSPQETAIATHLTSQENLLLMGGVCGLSATKSQSRANELMDLLEIENRKDQARKLSGGLKRRLSIAMALMSDPEILFLDEPTLGLDPHARRSVWHYIQKLKGEKTILLTTHYLEEADTLADTIAIMDLGKVIAKGTASELKQMYTSTQTIRISGTPISPELVREFSDHGLAAMATGDSLELIGIELDIYHVIDQLRNHGVTISSIQMTEPSLEDVFIQLTGKQATS